MLHIESTGTGSVTLSSEEKLATLSNTHLTQITGRIARDGQIGGVVQRPKASCFALGNDIEPERDLVNTYEPKKSRVNAMQISRFLVRFFFFSVGMTTTPRRLPH